MGIGKNIYGPGYGYNGLDDILPNIPQKEHHDKAGDDGGPGDDFGGEGYNVNVHIV